MSPRYDFFAAFKINESKKLINTKGLKDHVGVFDNQFVLTSIIGFLILISTMFTKEGSLAMQSPTRRLHPSGKNTTKEFALFQNGSNTLISRQYGTMS